MTLYFILLAIAAALVAAYRANSPKYAVTFTLTKGTPVPDTLTTDQTIPLLVTGIDAKKNPAKFPAGVVPAWTPVDPSVGVLTVSADSMSATLNPVATGSITITVTVPFTVPITKTLTITVTVGVAVDFTLTSGTPTP